MSLGNWLKRCGCSEGPVRGLIQAQHQAVRLESGVSVAGSWRGNVAWCLWRGQAGAIGAAGGGLRPSQFGASFFLLTELLFLSILLFLVFRTLNFYDCILRDFGW